MVTTFSWRLAHTFYLPKTVNEDFRRCWVTFSIGVFAGELHIRLLFVATVVWGRGTSSDVRPPEREGAVHTELRFHASFM